MAVHQTFGVLARDLFVGRAEMSSDSPNIFLGDIDVQVLAVLMATVTAPLAAKLPDERAGKGRVFQIFRPFELYLLLKA
jgi:hypothetical protein